jgi:hypothetical protein
MVEIRTLAQPTGTDNIGRFVLTLRALSALLLVAADAF